MSPRYQSPPYSPPLRTPSRTRARDHNHDHNHLDLNRDSALLFSPLDAGLPDRVGDYVARRLVPVMLGRSERPLQLVMNFGTLHLADEGGYRRGSSSAGSSNAVVYNAPGCVMSMGSGGTGVAGGGIGGRRPSLLGGIDGEGVGAYGYGYGYGAREKKRVGICDGCFKRQLVGASGWCVECELGAAAGTGERMAGLDGVRYGYGRMPEGGSEWARREEREERERERLREMDERLRDLERARKMRRERERRASGLGGYYSDFERDEFRYATDRDGYGTLQSGGDVSAPLMPEGFSR